MTDAEWLACEDPHALLAAAADRGGERKLWLFIAGSLRLDWARLNGRLRRMVKVMERFADGRSRGQTLLRAMASAWRRDTSAADLRPGPMA